MLIVTSKPLRIYFPFFEPIASRTPVDEFVIVTKVSSTAGDFFIVAADGVVDAAPLDSMLDDVADVSPLGAR